MAGGVSGLGSALLKGEELIAEVYKGGILATAAQLEVEQPAIECERRIDVADFKRDVVEADGARFPVFRHGASDRPAHDARCVIGTSCRQGSGGAVR